MAITNSFIGTGWRWPSTDPRRNRGRLGGTELEQAMYLILATDPGERPMRPEFGGGCTSSCSPADATTAAPIAVEVHSALLAGSRA